MKSTKNGCEKFFFYFPGGVGLSDCLFSVYDKQFFGHNCIFSLIPGGICTKRRKVKKRSKKGVFSISWGCSRDELKFVWS